MLLRLLLWSLLTNWNINLDCLLERNVFRSCQLAVTIQQPYKANFIHSTTCFKLACLNQLNTFECNSIPSHEIAPIAFSQFTTIILLWHMPNIAATSLLQFRLQQSNISKQSKWHCKNHPWNGCLGRAQRIACLDHVSVMPGPVCLPMRAFRWDMPYLFATRLELIQITLSGN